MRNVCWEPGFSSQLARTTGVLVAVAPSSNIPSNPAYGVYSSRLVAIARACDSFDDFKDRHDSLCFKLYQQGFTYQKLCRQLKKASQKHRDTFAKYGQKIEVPLPVMANTNRHVTLRS